MFGKTAEKTEKANAEARKYDITVEAVRHTKNDKILMIDLVVNGVWIKSCMLKEVTVKKDGEVHKKGDTVYMLNFPSEKSGNKYYNRAWFPYSNADIENICNQVKALV